MKKTAIVMAVLVTVLISAPAWAQHIVGSPHDLSTRLGIGEVCLPCHAPHNAPNAAVGPLWNHALTNNSSAPAGANLLGPAAANFSKNGTSTTLYSSSLLCMGCHDGVTAVGDFSVINSHITVNDTTDAIQNLTGARVVNGVFVNDVGVNLTYVHPVGVKYPQLSGSGSSFNTATSSVSHYSGATQYKVGTLSLEAGSTANTNDTVGCTTCHTPHDDTTAPPFLVMSNSSSALCLTCHIQ